MLLFHEGTCDWKGDKKLTFHYGKSLPFGLERASDDVASFFFSYLC